MGLTVGDQAHVGIRGIAHHGYSSPPPLRRVEEGLAGRDHEQAALSGWLDMAACGRGRVVLVSGEAGIGKSRLVAAAADRARGEGHRVLVGRTTEADGAPPNWPWLAVLDPLGARHVLEAPSGADPDSEQFTRLDAASVALLAEPALVVVEDMHRADPASLRFLGHLADRVAAQPVLLVVTFRPNPTDQANGFASVLDVLTRAPGTERLELTGLDGASVARLIGPDASARTVAAVMAASDGNPLLVGELARHLRAGGTLAAVPRSVRDSVAARLGQRSSSCVEVVRVAAIAGRTFPAGLVATAAGRPALGVLGDLDEAIGAGLVEPTGSAGQFRFVHALVRDAVIATLRIAELARYHRGLALAVEAYEGDGDAQAAELARRWDAASVLGDRTVAAHWCERAAVVAERQLAWEDAARLFDRSLELGGPAMEPRDEHRRAIGSARTRLQCGESATAEERCVRAASAARRGRRPDLMAEAALVLDGRSVNSPELREVALEALRELPVEAHSMHARVHGELTNMGFYLDPASMAHHCAAAEAEAAQAADPLADLAAIRARHMLSYGPEHAATRLALAERLGRVARSIHRPSVELWEPLWRIDALVELGRLPEAVAALGELRGAVKAAGAPIARWHLARTEAALAQGTARFDEALVHAREARRLFALLEHPYGAEAIYIGFQIGVATHTGWTKELADAWSALDLDQAPPFLGELPLLGLALTAAGVGDMNRARAVYDRVSPAAGWNPPPALWVFLHAMRIQVAALLGARADLAALYAALEPNRDRQVGSGGGVVNYLGPVEVWLGVAAAALDRVDDAACDLAVAGDAARAAGAPGFAVHADVARAEVLARRSAPGDAEEARAALTASRPAAQRLGMTPFVKRIDDALAGAAGARDEAVLSPREHEVGALVAAGHTNRQIAAQLYISERTAQNHVQHILTKLGVSNRTQIAAWLRHRSD